MRILILSFTYLPNKDGVAVAASAMAQQLAEQGHSVTVGTGYLVERQETIVSGVTVVQFDVSGSSNWRVGIVGQVEEFKEFVATFPADVIVCHGWSMWATDLAQQVFHRTKAKKVLVSHGFIAHEIPWRRKFPYGLLFWAGWMPYILSMPWRLSRFDAVVFLSRRMGLGRFIDHTAAFLIRHPKVAIIPNGIDPKEFAHPRAAFRSKYGLDERFVILNVANYFPTKSQEEVLRAFREARLRNAALVFIGSTFNEHSAYLKALDRRLCTCYPDGDVIFMEKITREMLCAAYCESDIFVTASRFETQPIVLLEAMAAGLPFVARDVGCVRDFPGGSIIPKHGNFRKAITDLYADPAARAHLSHEGRNAVAQFYSRSKVSEQFELLLESL